MAIKLQSTPLRVIFHLQWLLVCIWCQSACSIPAVGFFDGFFLPPLSKRSESRDGYCSVTQMPCNSYEIVPSKYCGKLTDAPPLRPVCGLDPLQTLKACCSHLQTDTSIRGTTLSWFTSYLTGRSQFVSCAGHTSSPRPVTCGVPQVSVLGIFFSVFTHCLSTRDTILALFSMRSILNCTSTLIYPKLRLL